MALTSRTGTRSVECENATGEDIMPARLPAL